MKDELRIKLKRRRGLFSGEERVDADGKIFEKQNIIYHNRRLCDIMT